MKTEDHTLRRNWNRWEACFVARRIDFAIVGIRKFNDFAGERIVEAESSFPVAETLFWKKHPILFWINSPRSTIKNSFKVLSSCISTDIEDCVYFVCEKGRRDGTNRNSSPIFQGNLSAYLTIFAACQLLQTARKRIWSTHQRLLTIKSMTSRGRSDHEQNCLLRAIANKLKIRLLYEPVKPSLLMWLATRLIGNNLPRGVILGQEKHILLMCRDRDVFHPKTHIILSRATNTLKKMLITGFTCYV